MNAAQGPWWVRRGCGRGQLSGLWHLSRSQRSGEPGVPGGEGRRCSEPQAGAQHTAEPTTGCPCPQATGSSQPGPETSEAAANPEPLGEAPPWSGCLARDRAGADEGTTAGFSMWPS